MSSIKDRYNYVEIKTYAAYSEVSKELGLTMEQVGTVYEWFLKKTIEDIVERPTVKVRLSGLGVLVFNPRKALNIIAKKIHSELILLDNPKDDLTCIRAYTVYDLIGDWFKMFEERYQRGKDKKLYNDYYVDFFDRDNKKNQLSYIKLYESIQRVHGSRPEGVKESR